MDEARETETKIVEVGTFKREYYRKGKKKHVKTERLKKNPKKVTLLTTKDVELYCYPYEYPESVFIGQYPNFTWQLDETEIRDLLRIYNRARWFLTQKWTENNPKTKKKLKSLRDSIISAYNYALKNQKRKK